MYLENGREIYESDKYPGYYIDANTGDFCDENGHYVGGNQDNGDKPGGCGTYSPFYHMTVYVSKSGRQYYPKKTKAATIPMRLSDAVRQDYRPSRGYQSFIRKESSKQSKRK